MPDQPALPTPVAAGDDWPEVSDRLMGQAGAAAGGPAWDQAAGDLLARLAPRDPAEELLAVQMLATHARALFLARQANRQKHPKWFALYSDQCRQAMELFRRQLLTLAEYRRPRRGRRPP